MTPKNIFLTGASSGIGEATARLLHQQGHTLYIAARNGKKLLALSQELGDRLYMGTLDVRDYNAFGAAVSDATKKMGCIDVLINNAGIGFFNPVSEGTIDEWHEMIDVNVKGLLNGIHAALPNLIQSNGQIINIGSVASHQVFPNSGVYCASKHAVFAISESIRLELPDKVRVTTISPGSVNTPFIDKTQSEAMLKDYKPYFAAGLSPDLVAMQVAHAVNCPHGAVISEIIVRPSRQVK